MSEEDAIMFPPQDIGLCGVDNSDDLGMIAGTVAVCLRCGQDNCPIYLMLEEFRKKGADE